MALRGAAALLSVAIIRTPQTGRTGKRRPSRPAARATAPPDLARAASIRPCSFGRRGASGLRNRDGGKRRQRAAVFLHVVNRMLHLSRHVNIQKCRRAVVYQANVAWIFSLLSPRRVHHAVIEDVRQGAAECRGHRLDVADAAVRKFSSARNFVVVDIDVLQKGIVALVLRREYLARNFRGRSFL